MAIPSADRTLVMGIVNVTPDSFSDGGDYFTPDAAIAHAHQLISEGADLLDIGGESTRPGSQRPSPAEELNRVIPVVEALADTGIPVSVDTMRASVAAAALDAGAQIINDVSGGLADGEMLELMAERNKPYIAMHWRGHGSIMQNADHLNYDEVVSDVYGELQRRVEACMDAGIKPENLILDPGIGFSKTAEHNWEILRQLELVQRLDFPLLLGVSRKRFLGSLLAHDGIDREPKNRDDATLALTVFFAQQSCWAVRTHTVRAHRDAIAVVEQMRG
ncbi:MAG: dihydropteroate synthase [Propionibacteriaceae bacterium]